MNTRLRAIIVSLRIAATITAAVIVMALWHLMLWMPWQLDCAMAVGAALVFAYQFERTAE
jgi:hypothetical protein